MPLPTDRGHAVLTTEADGSVSVGVCLTVNDGRPSEPYATHYRPPSVVVHEDVEVVQGETARYTKGLVVVFADNSGAVHVANPPDAELAPAG
jgi:hypothetical protein